jgi:Flp pilus assembly protein TadD
MNVEARPGVAITVKVDGNGWRWILGASASLALAFSSPFGTTQNRSSQTNRTQSPAAVTEAQSSLARGNPDEAIETLSRYLQAHPSDSSARLILGQAYALAGQNARAVPEFRSVLEESPNNVAALTSLGGIYYRTGQLEKAEPVLARASKASHGDPAIRTEWAMVLARMHRYNEAQRALAGLALPNNRQEQIAFHRLKASVNLGLGNSLGAASEMEHALALKPADLGLNVATAAAEMQSKNWRRAASLAEPIFTRSHDPGVGLVLLEAQMGMGSGFRQTLEVLRSITLPRVEEAEFRQRLAELLIAHGQVSESVEEFKKAADLDPSRVDLIFNLALAQFRAGLLDDALESAEKGKTLSDNADLEDLLGDIQEARGDNMAAARSYQAAVALAPNEEKYRLSLAVELIRHKNFDAAKLVLKQAEELQAKSWRIQFALGMVEYFTGTDEEATRILIRAVDLAPAPDIALRYLGEIQMDQASAPDPVALAKLCQLSDRHPGDGKLFYYCGALLFRRDYASGDKKYADEIVRKLGNASRLLQDDPSPHCQLGRAYRWLDRWQDALHESEACASMDPNSAEAHYRLARIYQHLGRQERSQAEMKLYEAASKRIADENAHRDETIKTFLYTIQNETPDHK